MITQPMMMSGQEFDPDCPCIAFIPASGAVSVYTGGKSWGGVIEYSNGGKWRTWDGSEVAGNRLYFRGTDNTFITAVRYTTFRRWVVTGTDVSCTGNIESLLDWEKVEAALHPTVAGCAFWGMFSGCACLISGPSLPSELTSSAPHCYDMMFSSCTSLRAAPSLPSTIVPAYAYSYMFNGCTSLTTIPSLPALQPSSSAYLGMFKDCTGLRFSTTRVAGCENAYRIPTTGTGSSPGTDWNKNMFSGTTGPFTGNPSINTTYYTNATAV